MLSETSARRRPQPFENLGPIFPANGAWLAVQVLAHSWTARILDEGVVTTKTLRHPWPGSRLLCI